MRLLPLLTAAALLTACGGGSAPAGPAPENPGSAADTLRLSGVVQIGTLGTGPAGETTLRRTAWNLGEQPLLAYAFGGVSQDAVALLAESAIALDGSFDLVLPRPPERALEAAAGALVPEPGCTLSGVNVTPGLRTSEGLLFAELPGGLEPLAQTDLGVRAVEQGETLTAAATYRQEVYLYADRAGQWRERLNCADENGTFVFEYDLDLQPGWNRRSWLSEVTLSSGPGTETVGIRLRMSGDPAPQGWLLDRSEDDADLGANALVPSSVARAVALAREAAQER